MPTFSSDELERALKEVASWGLSSYTILPRSMCATDAEARAQVELLDGANAIHGNNARQADSAVISVSDQGWKVCLRSISNVESSRLWEATPLILCSDMYSEDINLPPHSADKDNQTFETLDDLLAYLSPAFQRKRDAQLMSRLSELAARQAENGIEPRIADENDQSSDS
ncbi:hypothetical protein OIV83_001803 [Microbotryomycetes sp. JL201]|nr:hypothetical protein OIV83_001803 [Microbotryomycetes sp. JL201]